MQVITLLLQNFNPFYEPPHLPARGHFIAEHFIYLPIPSKRNNRLLAIILALSLQKKAPTVANETLKIIVVMRFTTTAKKCNVTTDEIYLSFCSEPIHFRDFRVGLELELCLLLLVHRCCCCKHMYVVVVDT